LAVTIYGGHYTVSIAITNPGAVTNLQVVAAALKPFAVIRAGIEPAQAALVTEAGAVIRIARKTAVATGTTAIAATLFLNHDNGADAGFTAGHTATGEGTETDVISYGWNSKAGWDWFPTPEEYIVCPAAVTNAIALRSNVAPPAGIYVFRMTCVELG
jgi:hypothetical protein